MKIAAELTKKDWENLQLSPDDDTNWDEGIKFFKKRFDNRFIKPIDQILENDTKSGEGFAAMALICLLLEALQAFERGAIYCYPKYDLPNGNKVSSAKLIRNFLRSNKPFKSQISSDNTDDFFREVRSGLLHEARTKSNWLIRAEHESFLFEELTEEQVNYRVIYRTNFFEALKRWKNNYEKKLLNTTPESQKLRSNFIRKMNDICSQ